MLFPTVEYALFFLVAFFGAWGLARGATWHPAHKGFLLVMSWFFYGWGDWRFLPVLIGLSLEATLVAMALELGLPQRTRRAVLALGIVGALGTLAVFKYLGFFTSATLSAAHAFGLTLPAPRLPELALPVGVSFFTFHAVSLMVDAYRRAIAVPVKPLDGLLYVAFFPQLVAGPILRASQFLPTLAKPRTEADLDLPLALQRIALGLFKKVIVAQVLATTLVEPLFDDPAAHGGLAAWFGVYAYAAQIYCDFSGYTDLAIGSALLLGYRMPENFDAPYSAQSPRDFWRRWHLSLSTWLRDYLFIPLGGSRGSAFTTGFALAATMVLGGLWHGAAWTFVAWGALHGGWLVLHRAWSSTRLSHRLARSSWWAAIATVLTFHAVCVGWVFFRAPGFTVALEVFGALVQRTQQAPPVGLMLLTGLGLALAAWPGGRWDGWARERLASLPPAQVGLGFGVLLVVLDAVGPRGLSPFIYFQF